MIDYLSCEICKSDNTSRFYKFTLDDDNLFLETSLGLRGMYNSNGIQTYRCSFKYAQIISSKIEPLKISSWPRRFPNDYVPGNPIMGCDPFSWSIDYRESGKKNTCHIRGKGNFPDDYPYDLFLIILNQTLPEKDLIRWLIS